MVHAVVHRSSSCLSLGRFGRRVTIVVCTAVQIPVSVLAAVVPDRVAFAVLRTVLAAATAGQFNTAFILGQSRKNSVHSGSIDPGLRRKIFKRAR